jgi:hypothetical protein
VWCIRQYCVCNLFEHFRTFLLFHPTTCTLCFHSLYHSQLCGVQLILVQELLLVLLLLLKTFVLQLLLLHCNTSMTFASTSTLSITTTTVVITTITTRFQVVVVARIRAEPPACTMVTVVELYGSSSGRSRVSGDRVVYARFHCRPLFWVISHFHSISPHTPVFCPFWLRVFRFCLYLLSREPPSRFLKSHCPCVSNLCPCPDLVFFSVWQGTFPLECSKLLRVTEMSCTVLPGASPCPASLLKFIVYAIVCDVIHIT